MILASVNSCLVNVQGPAEAVEDPAQAEGAAFQVRKPLYPVVTVSSLCFCERTDSIISSCAHGCSLLADMTVGLGCQHNQTCRVCHQTCKHRLLLSDCAGAW